MSEDFHIKYTDINGKEVEIGKPPEVIKPTPAEKSQDMMPPLQVRSDSAMKTIFKWTIILLMIASGWVWHFSMKNPTQTAILMFPYDRQQINNMLASGWKLHGTEPSGGDQSVAVLYHCGKKIIPVHLYDPKEKAKGNLDKLLDEAYDTHKFPLVESR